MKDNDMECVSLIDYYMTTRLNMVNMVIGFLIFLFAPTLSVKNPISIVFLASIALNVFLATRQKLSANERMRLVIEAMEQKILQEGKAAGTLQEMRLASPPRKGVFLLYLFLPKKNRDAVIGDLEEEYQEVAAKYGEPSAKVWFYKQVLTSLWPMIKIAGRSLVKWGFVGWLEEIIRRIAH